MSHNYSLLEALLLTKYIIKMTHCLSFKGTVAGKKYHLA